MNCCICGTKLSFFQGTASLRYKDKQYPLCEHCSKIKIQLLNEKSTAIQEQAILTLKIFLKTRGLPTPIVKPLFLICSVSTIIPRPMPKDFVNKKILKLAGSRVFY